MPKFVEVTVKATGDTQIVPEHWIGHPVLGAGFKAEKASASGSTKATDSAKATASNKE